jgi:hypothetical protein
MPLAAEQVAIPMAVTGAACRETTQHLVAADQVRLLLTTPSVTKFLQLLVVAVVEPTSTWVALQEW